MLSIKFRHENETIHENIQFTYDGNSAGLYVLWMNYIQKNAYVYVSISFIFTTRCLRKNKYHCKIDFLLFKFFIFRFDQFRLKKYDFFHLNKCQC